MSFQILIKTMSSRGLEEMEKWKSMTREEFVEHFKSLVGEKSQEAHHSPSQKEKEAFNKAIKLIGGIIGQWSNHDTENNYLKVSTANTIMNSMKDMLDDYREVVKLFLEEIEPRVGEMGQKTEEETEEEHERVDECYRLHEDSFGAIPYEKDNIYIRNEEYPGLTRQISDDYQHFPGFEFEFKVLKDLMSCMKLPKDRDLLMGIFIEHFGEV